MSQVKTVKAIKYSSYSPVKSPDGRRIGMGERIAHFLMWVSAQDQDEVIPFARIAQSVLSLQHLPRSTERDVSKIKDALAPAAKVLRDKYQRDLVQVTGVGCRATNSPDDATKNVLGKKLRRRDSIDRSIGDSRDQIDETKVTDPTNQAILRFTDAQVMKPGLLKDREALMKLLPSSKKTAK